MSGSLSLYEVFEVVGRDLHHLVAVGRPEVDIVVDDGTVVARIVEQSDDLRTDDRVDGKERAEDDDVVGLDVGIDKVELVVRVVFIEDVLRVVVVVEESERYRRL